uniref:Uncharacterized protein n=1 Tax=Ascaris lumbricoides TaxID=6252 RepID=A0A0M3HJP6_ASCLU
MLTNSGGDNASIRLIQSCSNRISSSRSNIGGKLKGIFTNRDDFNSCVDRSI